MQHGSNYVRTGRLWGATSKHLRRVASRTSPAMTDDASPTPCAATISTTVSTSLMSKIASTLVSSFRKLNAECVLMIPFPQV